MKINLFISNIVYLCFLLKPKYKTAGATANMNIYALLAYLIPLVVNCTGIWSGNRKKYATSANAKGITIRSI